MYGVAGWRRNEKCQQLGSQEHIRYVYARVGNGVEGRSISKGKYEGARDGSCRRKFVVEDA